MNHRSKIAPDADHFACFVLERLPTQDGTILLGMTPRTSLVVMLMECVGLVSMRSSAKQVSISIPVGFTDEYSFRSRPGTAGLRNGRTVKTVISYLLSQDSYRTSLHTAPYPYGHLLTALHA